MYFEPVEPQRLIKSHLLEVLDALLFVGMGVGKTAASLDALNYLFRTAQAVSALIVAPKRVANLTWPMEVRDWDQFKWMKVANLRTEAGQRAFLNGSAHIYLINYESLHQLVSLVERRGGTIPYDVVLFDELTKAKNPSSKRINLYRRRVPRPARSWGLTGTPAPNSWGDLFAQVRLIDGGQRLGTNYLGFKTRYLVEDPRAEYTHAKPTIKEGVAETLEQKISDITLTLKSSDWLKLPDMVVEDVEINFTPGLEKQYKRLEEKLVLELQQGKTLNVANAAALVTKLSQFTSGRVYDEERSVHTFHDLKYDELAKIAKKEKQPVLVACIYQHEQDRIRKLFPHAKFFADAKNEKQEEQLLNDWNAGKIRMLVSHPASVGHGLNLQYGSSIMVWVSLTYSRELYEQMIARLARRGQKNLLRIYRLMVSGTVDEAIAEALANKAEDEARLLRTLQTLESYRPKKSDFREFSTQTGPNRTPKPVNLPDARLYPRKGKILDLSQY
jgi:SNF2 family DNA or RNA helicase